MGDQSASETTGENFDEAGDEALVIAISEGDDRAFTTLLGRHLDAVFGYLYRMTSSHADAEDLAQETFLRVWRKASSYQPGRVKVSTWLHTIAHNLAIDSFRRKREIPMDLAIEEADTDSDPAHQNSIRQQRQLLDAAISRLPDAQRSAILLCQVQGFSNAQAATIMGVNTRALESLLARARRTLRAGLFANQEAD